MRLGLLFVLALALLAIVLAVAYLQPKTRGPETDETLLSLETDSGLNPYTAGSAVTVFGHANCAQTVRIYAEGRQVCSAEVSASDSSYACSFKAENPGSFELRAESGACSETKIIYVKAPECNPGDSRNCTLGNGCPGISICANGAWGGCSATGVVCMPGSKAGCGMPDGCGFGYEECNQCGTGYGKCSAAMK
ncbi:MAG: hypothetical protein NT157_01955 [Candidatus Micrarchaeota archaeon]|nr:hypothetical protein [Candidatus Micrarchaeota archaeon]